MSSPVFIPDELLDIMLGSLAIRHLASASLVSRSWRNLIFPYLYHTVYLTLASHLEQLATRISLEHEHQSIPPVSAYLRELVLDEEHGQPEAELRIGERPLSCLTAIIPHLLRLEHFSWDMGFLFRDAELLHALQSECPSLKSVHFAIKDGDGMFDFEDDAYIKLFDFTDLFHFSLTIHHIRRRAYFPQLKN
ncbi:hypothetical protein BDV93DRAFT_38483 [Ceratobasidium sp. AG-I]|nr:hypothetical protein BDV93DRAFT_38483 [Ceratobasidium sp. AG-I]